MQRETSLQSDNKGIEGGQTEKEGGYRIRERRMECKLWGRGVYNEREGSAS
jgi:hypothetical protein